MVFDYVKKGRIAYLTINRPEAMNARNAQVRQQMEEAMVDFRDDPDVWVAIVTGAGDRAFSVGADIKDFSSGGAREREVETVRPDTIWKPFIAAINGYALGGGLELALQCDIRIAADHARLGLPEIKIGYMPGAGGTQRLPRFVPRAVAAEMILTGNHIDAQEAYRIGLISRVVPLAQLMPAANEMAETICQRGPLGVRTSKEAMIRGYSMPLEEGLELEKALNNSLKSTEDFKEGARAFAEKRPPQYKAK